MGICADTQTVQKGAQALPIDLCVYCVQEGGEERIGCIYLVSHLL